MTAAIPDGGDGSGYGTWYDLLRTDPDAALRDVIARRELHRTITHNALDAYSWFDCSSCAVLDKQLGRAREANNK